MPEETIDKEDDVAQPEDIHSFPVNLPYPDFPIELGNHRMVVQVNNYQPVVRVNLPWRCPRVDTKSTCLIRCLAHIGSNSICEVRYTNKASDLSETTSLYSTNTNNY